MLPIFLTTELQQLPLILAVAVSPVSTTACVTYYFKDDIYGSCSDLWDAISPWLGRREGKIGKAAP